MLKTISRYGVIVTTVALLVGTSPTSIDAETRPAKTDSGAEAGLANAEAQLRAAEVAFAQTMAERDLKAFESFLSDEVVFFSGGRVLRGPDAVVTGWSRYFEGAAAPFSWTPEAVTVLESGTLGFSSGPVLDPDGNRIGTFNSVWRLEDGRWRVAIDRGCPACDCP